ncbi:MAG TPA: polysaccharide deacetylase family protein [Verrucomicrobiales bacterium]|nr:polysaccharide deacetylase family protein [Verrucomicrobiales bacterium]HIL72319.1 polysaccharide deacetylase family protein [Verrucomicrobiota bacterium]
MKVGFCLFLGWVCLACGQQPTVGGTKEKRVVLTFDDSVRSHYTVVRPLLKELGFSATFFITEGFDFKTNKEDYMTWEQIRGLHDDGFEIGNHTRDHMGVTDETLIRLPEQIEVINQQCRKYGIPKPVSFGYPGNAFTTAAIPILKRAGFKFARRGGSPEYDYNEGGGVAFEPGKDHPLLIPSIGDARPNWTLGDFKAALSRAGGGGVPVLQFHGVPDRQHPWVHTPPEKFREYMDYLRKNHYRVLALRDLEEFVDLQQIPNDPEAVMADRTDQIQQEKAFIRDLSGSSPSGPPVPELSLGNDSLDVLIKNNSESPGILSGLQSLFHKQGAPDFDAFDPDTRGASAGLNFEHIISGHPNKANKFTPRHGFYPLYRTSEKNNGLLVRRAADSPWEIDSSLNYSLTNKNAIDFTFRCRVKNPEVFGERNYAVFFFANYMNDVADSALHFIGIEREGGAEKWIRAEAPSGHPDYNGGGTYRRVQADPLEYDKDHNFKLNLWSYDAPRFSKPFYYGLASNDMVMILMFDPMHSQTEEMRFSLFKFKLPRHPRPAWDFQYVIRQIEKNRPYGFSGRMVWKPFVSREDCLQEYLNWSRGKSNE